MFYYLFCVIIIFVTNSFYPTIKKPNVEKKFIFRRIPSLTLFGGVVINNTFSLETLTENKYFIDSEHDYIFFYDNESHITDLLTSLGKVEKVWGHAYSPLIAYQPKNTTNILIYDLFLKKIVFNFVNYNASFNINGIASAGFIEDDLSFFIIPNHGDAIIYKSYYHLNNIQLKFLQKFLRTKQLYVIEMTSEELSIYKSLPEYVRQAIVMIHDNTNKMPDKNEPFFSVLNNIF